MRLSRHEHEQSKTHTHTPNKVRGKNLCNNITFC
jgi:hypothetical protein